MQYANEREEGGARKIKAVLLPEGLYALLHKIAEKSGYQDQLGEVCLGALSFWAASARHELEQGSLDLVQGAAVEGKRQVMLEDISTRGSSGLN